MKFFPTFFGSFYNPKTYERVRYESQASGVLYAFTLVALTSLIATVLVLIGLHAVFLTSIGGREPAFDSFARQIAQQLPPMHFVNGELSVDGPQPLVIHVQSGEFTSDLATIDTTGATDYRRMHTPILVTRTETITRGSSDDAMQEKIEIQPHSKFLEPGKDYHFTTEQIRASAEELIAGVHRYAWLIHLIMGGLVFACVTLVYFVLRLVMLLALGVVATIMGNAGGRMDYKAGFRMASVAYTPVAAIAGIAFLATLKTPSAPVLFALGSLMLLIALSISRRPVS